MTMEEFITEFGSIVEGKAAQLARQFPGIESDDITQEIYLAMMSPSRLKGAARFPEYVERVVYVLGKTYCERERDDFMFHSAQYVYTPAEIRALFTDAFFQRDIWEQAPKKDDGTSVTAGGVVIALWDLDAAFSAQSQEDQLIIQKKCDHKETLIGGEQDRYERAIDKVVRFLNRGIVIAAAESHDGPGSRRAMSNASARYATSEV